MAFDSADAYDRFMGRFSDGEGVEGSSFLIGARFNFGGGTLKSRDRTGASFEGFGRARGF